MHKVKCSCLLYTPHISSLFVASSERKNIYNANEFNTVNVCKHEKLHLIWSAF